MTLSAFSQTDQSNSTDRHELKINGFNLAVLKAPNISYEYLINENRSIGLGLLHKIDSEPQEKGWTAEVTHRIYSVTPYFRRYFSKGYESGFFIDGFGMLNCGDTADFEFDISNEAGEYDFVKVVNKYTHFVLGITFGGKFLLGKKGFF